MGKPRRIKVDGIVIRTEGFQNIENSDGSPETYLRAEIFIEYGGLSLCIDIKNDETFDVFQKEWTPVMLPPISVD